MKTIQITDESLSGKVLNELLLNFENEYISVEELIKERINAEIQRYESSVEDYKNGLVLPTRIEQKLNRKERPKIDLEKQWYVALEAFKNNGFFILVDNEQVEELKQKVHVDESTKVSFVKLTPLVGG